MVATNLVELYCMKLHLVVNHRGEILSYSITSGNVSDREPIKSGALFQKLSGKAFGDCGYISGDIVKQLALQGLHFITKQAKYHKPIPISIEDMWLLSRRAIIETVIGLLKSSCQIEHSRHRSVNGFKANLAAGLIAYQILVKKPNINLLHIAA